MFLSKGYKGIYDLYFTNPATGRRTKVSTGKSILRDARAFSDEFQIDSLLGKKPKIVNLEQLKEDVLEYVHFNFSPKTYEVYSMSLKNFIRITGNRQLSLLGMRDFEHYKNERSKSVTKTTVNIELRTLKAAFSYAVKNGFIKTNPAQTVKQFSLAEKEKLSFSDEELITLFEFITDKLVERIVLFGLHTGCRLSEILNVQFKDIDMENRVLTIRNKAEFKTKTGKIRHIPISNSLERIVIANLGYSGDDYVFSFDGPKRLNKDFISKKFKKYLRKAGLPEKFHFHCLRHTFITNMIKSGVPINFVKELAGHSDIQTTMGYVHIGLEDLRSAVDNFKVAV